jgi:hypothetical protein
MAGTNIFWPVMAQIALVVAIYFLLGWRRARAVKAGLVKEDQVATLALDNRSWPSDVLKVSNNLANQFEAPVLFYVLCFLLYLLEAVSPLALALAWLFVLSRVAHTLIHVGSNRVFRRLRLFLAGVFVLLLMAGLVLARLLQLG